MVGHFCFAPFYNCERMAGKRSRLSVLLLGRGGWVCGRKLSDKSEYDLVYELRAEGFML